MPHGGEWQNIPASGTTIPSASARYLQYRAQFSGSDSATPVLRSVEAFYLPPNQPPVVTLQIPRGGEAWHGVKTVRWTAADLDKDTLAYEITVSRDGGKTWQAAPRKQDKPILELSVPANTGKTAPPLKAGRKTSPKSNLPALRDSLAQSPMSDTLKARILRDAKANGEPPMGDEDDAPVPDAKTVLPEGESREAVYSLDTSKLADGIYLLKVMATDRPANGENALTGEKITGEIRIVNTAPNITIANAKDAAATANKTVHLTGTATQKIVAIRGVQWRVNKGEWTTATPTDGLFDSGSESWTLQTMMLPSGKHTVEVQAVDEAGNQKTETVMVTVP